MIYHCYILYSASVDRYYVGSSSSIADRLRKHNSRHKGFTGQSADWQIVYMEAYASKKEAMAREKQIKRWKSRQKIEELIETLSSAG